MELPSNIERFRGELEKTFKTSNEIKFTVGETKPWESKLGGCPYLEKKEDYPLSGDGRPMMFLAQINFDEMPPLEDFPRTGILQFYVADDDMYGLDDVCTVRYIESYKKEEGSLLRENPYSTDYQGYEPFSSSGKMTFTQRQMPVSSSVVKFDEMFEDVADAEEMDALYDVCDAADSRVGGYPYFVQNSPAYYDDGDCDVLLLQLDVDDDCGIMFGDSGNCTFLISREDLLKRDFSNVEYDWQCC